MKKIFLAYLTILISIDVSAQKMHAICGEYTYNAPSNVSIEEATKIAIERAKVSALADEFGTIISQHNTTVLKNENGQSSTDFKSLSGSEVKGEWIEDTETPATSISYAQSMLIVKAKVCGKAREIIKATINFTAKLLRNGKEDKFESSSFRNNDDLYLSFQSPVKGYITVYLIDDEQNAFCLLPYAKDSDGQVEIEHGVHYIFFNTEAAPVNKRQIVDELTTSCSKSLENNLVYIIFSPNRFIKANDNQKSNDLPRELSYSEFQRWLIRTRNIDKDMQVEIKNIQITKE